ncbi:MAG: pilin [Candidatus Gracilibacteria bacterium]
MFKKLILITTILTIILANVQMAHGYGVPDKYRPINAPLGSLVSEDKIKTDDAKTLTNNLLQIIAGTLLYFAAPIGVIMIVMAAFTITYSGADTEKLEQGKKHLTWAIIGLVTVIFSFSVVKIIITFVVDTGNYATTTLQQTPAAPAGGQQAPVAPAAPANP